MKNTLFLTLLLIGLFQGFSQTKGLSYQAVILNPTAQEIPGIDASSNILANSKVVIQFTIVDAANNQEYQETHTTTTDPYGMVNLMIGFGDVTSGTVFNDITWDGLSKKLKVAIDFSGGGFDFVPLTEQMLTYMPQPANEETINLITDIATNVTNISSNATDISSNTSANTATQADVDQNESDSDAADNTHTTNIATNATNISSNDTDIAANTAANAATQADVDQNESDADTAIDAINTLADGKVYLGNASNQATEVTLSGDVTIDNTGASTIGADKVITGMIAEGTILVSDLADNAVETAKIKDANVTTAKIANANITTAKILDANVTNAKLDKTNIPLSGFAAAADDVALGANKLTDVADPTLAQDAATKNYVDASVLSNANLTGPITSSGNTTSVASQTGTGSTFVMSTSPTLTGSTTLNSASVNSTLNVASTTALSSTLNVAGVTTLSSVLNVAGVTNLSSTLNVAGVTTLTGVLDVNNTTDISGTLTLSTLTASLPVFSDGSKGLVSNPITGSGSVVMSVSPTFTGTPTLPTGTIATTQTAGNNSTAIATTAFVSTAVNTATSSNFVELTGNQTIAGNKTFSADVTVNSVKIGRGTGNDTANTMMGTNALGTGTGTRNTAVGYAALNSYSGTSFDNNTAVGYNGSKGVTSGQQNTSIGAEALMALTTGSHSTAIGAQTLLNVTGNGNTALGYRSGEIITTGSSNTFLGKNANGNLATMINATAVGANSTVTASNTIQLGNTSVTNVKTSGTITAGAITIPNTDGSANQVLQTNGSGVLSWATAASGGSSNITGLSDALVEGTSIYIGNDPSSTTSTAEYNVAVGTTALDAITTGDQNVAMGYNALGINTTGSKNTASGFYGLKNNTTGINNTAMGYSAGDLITTGSNNVILGYDADPSANNASNQIVIGYNATGAGDNTVQLGNTSITNVKTSGTITAGTVTYPNAHGTNGQVLQTNGSGALSWATSAGEAPGDAMGQMKYWNGSVWTTIAPGLNNAALQFVDGVPTWVGGTPPVVGGFVYGGVVFHIFISGELGYVAGETHGLVCAVSDQSSSIQWYNGSYTTTGATGTAIGTGATNTATIVSNQGSGSYAAQLCNDLILNGYSDWFLPSKDELNEMYELTQNAVYSTVISNGLTAFVTNFPYWSSTEHSSSNVWSEYLGNAYKSKRDKYHTYYVRAVRAF